MVGDNTSSPGSIKSAPGFDFERGIATFVGLSISFHH